MGVRERPRMERRKTDHGVRRKVDEGAGQVVVVGRDWKDRSAEARVVLDDPVCAGVVGEGVHGGGVVDAVGSSVGSGGHDSRER